MKRKEEIIKKLNLISHPEGGFYRETYRSPLIITNDNLPENIIGERNCSTAIFFLLTSETFSSFHKINQDEIWLFHEGSSLELHIISESGVYTKEVLGLNLAENEFPQIVVPANSWFAADVVCENSYSLVSCTVSPGFDFKDFELAEKDKLISQFPQHAEIIGKFTR